MKLSHLRAITAAKAERRTGALVTPLDGGTARFVSPDAVGADPLADTLRKRFATGRSGREDAAEGSVFITVVRPAPRLVVVGAVHVSQVLAPMATMAGFEVTVVDPRTAFATPERFAGVNLVPEWPEPETLAIDGETAVATLTHDPKIDDPALEAALATDCFYIGALGSRKTHNRRLERLAERGFGAAETARINGPIGLAIGASTPAEIAVSILAEVVAALRSERRTTTADKLPAAAQ